MAQENFNDLVAFLTVARERKLHQGRRRSWASRSRRSARPCALEERLGIRLLTRTTRSVSPTEAGERLLDRRPTVRRDRIGTQRAERAQGQAFRHDPHHGGRACGDFVLAPAIRKLAPDYPDINVEVIVDYGLTDIVAERYDAGIRLGEQVAKDMIAVSIGRDMRMAVVGRTGYFEARTAGRRRT